MERRPGASLLGSAHRDRPCARRGRTDGAGDADQLWQCNAAGRYHHPVDQHDAPLDLNFTGAGQDVTGAEGLYRFVTIKPGAYPWPNTPMRGARRISISGVFGPGFATRLVTQMYFPGDPLLQYDPIFQSTRRQGGARAADLRLRSRAQRAGMGARLPLRHGAARPRKKPNDLPIGTRAE